MSLANWWLDQRFESRSKQALEKLAGREAQVEAALQAACLEHLHVKATVDKLEAAAKLEVRTCASSGHQLKPRCPLQMSLRLTLWLSTFGTQNMVDPGVGIDAPCHLLTRTSLAMIYAGRESRGCEPDGV